MVNTNYRDCYDFNEEQIYNKYSAYLCVVFLYIYLNGSNYYQYKDRLIKYIIL